MPMPLRMVPAPPSPALPSGPRRMADPEARELLVRHRQGDGAAFPALLAEYRAMVYGYLVRAGVEDGVRDDLFQEVFLRVHAAASAFEPSRPLMPWLFTIVANTVRSHFRKRATQDRVIAGVVLAEPPDSRPGIEREVAGRETATFLETAVLALPLAQREVLLLTCVEGMEQGEVASALQIPVNTVKTHLRRARLALAAALLAREAGSTGKVTS